MRFLLTQCCMPLLRSTRSLSSLTALLNRATGPLLPPPKSYPTSDLTRTLGPSIKNNETALLAILSYHIIPGAEAYSSSLKNGMKLTTGLSAPGSPVPPLTARSGRGGDL